MKNEILIADSGSTKTDWAIVDANGVKKTFSTTGLNPYYLTESELIQAIKQNVLTQIDSPQNQVKGISFYGAGCRAKAKEMLLRSFAETMPRTNVEVENDLLGAARALFRNEPGMACIMGTGSNSCLYDGQEIVKNVSPLGYILGDEGSGAVLGKRLVADVLKRQCPTNIIQAFEEEFEENIDSIIEKVYRKPFPNKFLASFAPFLSTHRQTDYVQHLIANEFDRFITRNLMQYANIELSVGFVGSIANYFSAELTQAISRHGLRMGQIIKAPLAQLVNYHQARDF